MTGKDLFDKNGGVINVGVQSFGEAFRKQGVETAQVNWTPPVDLKAARLLEKLERPEIKAKIEEANQKALNALISGNPCWVGMKKVIDVVPGMKRNYILHSGPPIEWSRMGTLQQKGIIGGVLHEKLASDEGEAIRLMETGQIETYSAHDFSCIGAGVGIVTASMVANVCRDMNTGFEGYCIPFEGRDGLSVWGRYDEIVERNLQIIENEFAPTVDYVLEQTGGVSLGDIIAKCLQMGDELHTRQTAAGLLLVNQIVPLFLKCKVDNEKTSLCIEMLTSTERWFHPLAMASAMALLQSLKQIDYCTLVTMNCSNGIENGVKFSAHGSKWFLASAPVYEGQYFSSKWGPEDASLHIGDSTVTEVVGLGGFSAAASPAVLRLRNGSFKEAISQTEEMKNICASINHNWPIPLLNFTGPPIGIDLRKVIETGITPICHGGIISKEGGQIGAGAGRFPIMPYINALYEFCNKYEIK